jgi:hypothetical protein
MLSQVLLTALSNTNIKDRIYIKNFLSVTSTMGNESCLDAFPPAWHKNGAGGGSGGISQHFCKYDDMRDTEKYNSHLY